MLVAFFRPFTDFSGDVENLSKRVTTVMIMHSASYISPVVERQSPEITSAYFRVSHTRLALTHDLL
jgi:hypothetical protein